MRWKMNVRHPYRRGLTCVRFSEVRPDFMRLASASMGLVHVVLWD